jgi:hypothetical protein
MVAEVPGQTPFAVVVTVAVGKGYTLTENIEVAVHEPLVAVTWKSEFSVTVAETVSPTFEPVKVAEGVRAVQV